MKLNRVTGGQPFRSEHYQGNIVESEDVICSQGQQVRLNVSELTCELSLHTCILVCLKELKAEWKSSSVGYIISLSYELARGNPASYLMKMLVSVLDFYLRRGRCWSLTDLLSCDQSGNISNLFRMKHNKIFYLILGKRCEVANTLLLRLFYDDDAVTEDFCWMCICVDPCRGEREARVLDLTGVIDVTSESRTYGRTCRSLSGFPSWSWGTLGPFLCRRRSRCPRVWWRTPPQRSVWTSPCTAGETYKMCMWGCVRTETQCTVYV